MLINNPYINENDITDARNMAKAMSYEFLSSGWNRVCTADDLISAAYEGIAEAIVKFDPNKGTVKQTKFTSYAYFWIRKYLQMYVTKAKTLLSGSMSDAYRGLIPTSTSIDAIGTSYDEAGADHNGWLADGDEADTAITAGERNLECLELLHAMLAELPDFERTTYALSVGLGTLSGQAMTPRQMAHAMDCTVAMVNDGLKRAQMLMNRIKLAYVDSYATASEHKSDTTSQLASIKKCKTTYELKCCFLSILSDYERTVYNLSIGSCTTNGQSMSSLDIAIATETPIEQVETGIETATVMLRQLASQYADDIIRVRKTNKVRV